jgi:hypothetical protein
MNTARIINAARQIEEHQEALKWLKEYGGDLSKQGYATVKITLHYAGACAGAKEAQTVLEAYAALGLSELVMTSIRSCENTIEINREVITKEAYLQEIET